MDKKQLSVAEKQQANKNWELIEKVTKNSPNCWAEVTRLDTDFCRIQIKGTEQAFEVNLSGALDIIEDMFGLDIRAIATAKDEEKK